MSTSDEDRTPHLDAAKLWRDVGEAAGAASKTVDPDEHIRRIVREEIARATPTTEEILAAMARGIRECQPMSSASARPQIAELAVQRDQLARMVVDLQAERAELLKTIDIRVTLSDDARRLLEVLYEAAQGRAAELVSYDSLEITLGLSMDRFDAAQAQLTHCDCVRSTLDLASRHAMMLTPRGCILYKNMNPPRS